MSSLALFTYFVGCYCMVCFIRRIYQMRGKWIYTSDDVRDRRIRSKFLGGALFPFPIAPHLIRGVHLKFGGALLNKKLPT